MAHTIRESIHLRDNEDGAPRIAGVIPATMLAAMTPVIRSVTEYAASDYAWLHQKPIFAMGTYLLPVSDGAVLCAFDNMRLVCLYDPQARINIPVKLWCCEDLLNACQVTLVTRVDENGSPIPTAMRPRPGMVLIATLSSGVGLAVLSVHEEDRPLMMAADRLALGPDAADLDEDDSTPSLGSWMDRSHGQHLDYTGFRVEPADPTFVRALGRHLAGWPTISREHVYLNPCLVSDLMACATAIGAAPLDVRVTSDGQPDHVAVEFSSVENESFWAKVMVAREVTLMPVEAYPWRRELAAPPDEQGA